MDTTRTFSIERLIRMAIGYRLITDYRMTPRLVSLYRGAREFTFDPEEARLFLGDLVGRYQRAVMLRD